MTKQQNDHQPKVDPMENIPPRKPLHLDSDPAVLAVLLVFVLLFASIIPGAWLLLLGAVGLGLVMRWILGWYDRRSGKKP